MNDTLSKIKELAKKLREKTDYQSEKEVNADIDMIIKLCEAGNDKRIPAKNNLSL